MILRDLLNLMPEDEGTNIILTYFDAETGYHMGEDLYIRFDDPDKAFDLMIAEHFAEDEVIEITNSFQHLVITVDRELHKDTVLRWKQKAADKMLRQLGMRE